MTHAELVARGVRWPVAEAKLVLGRFGWSAPWDPAQLIEDLGDLLARVAEILTECERLPRASTGERWSGDELVGAVEELALELSIRTGSPADAPEVQGAIAAEEEEREEPAGEPVWEEVREGRSVQIVDGIPRRNRVDLLTPAEVAICETTLVVELLGAHPCLTEVVNRLASAREELANWVDLGSPGAAEAVKNAERLPDSQADSQAVIDDALLAYLSGTGDACTHEGIGLPGCPTCEGRWNRAARKAVQAHRDRLARERLDVAARERTCIADYLRGDGDSGHADAVNSGAYKF